MDTRRQQLVVNAACSRERPTCSACAESGAECQYSSKIIRSPLTRAYLSNVEQRVRKLEELCSRLLPNTDIDEVLSSPNKFPIPAILLREQPRPDVSRDLPSNGDSSLETISDAVPGGIQGFDWTEDATSLDNLADGMAALRIEPSGAGYLGSTSGVAFLRSLLMWTGNPTLLSHTQLRAADQASESPQFTTASARLSEASISRQVESRLIEAYFEKYHLVYPFVHEATFRAQYHEVIPRPVSASWKMLLYTILALGSWSSGQTQTDLDKQLYRRSVSLSEDKSIFEIANLTTIQALVLLSNLSQKRNRPNTGWNMLGLATRMALSLGLHREQPSWNISVLHREMRRRVWWGLFLFDSGASTTFGRPILLPDRNTMEAHYVSNIDDEVSMPRLITGGQTEHAKELTPRTSNMPEESSNPTIYSGMKAQATFHVESNYISNSLLFHGGVSAEEALSMNDVLDRWTNSLPKYFQISQETWCFERWYLFARARLYWRLWNLKIILLRQILMRQIVKGQGGLHPSGLISGEAQCSHICLEAAHLTITSIDDYVRHSELTKIEVWYSTYFLFHAALVTLIPILANHEPGNLDAWMADIHMASALFRQGLAENPLAAHCADILDRLSPDESLKEASTLNEIHTAWMAGISDFSTFSTGPEGFFDSFGWEDIGAEF